MNEEAKHQMDGERYRLFRRLWATIIKREEELREEFHIARNLACSSWKHCSMGLEPTKYDPESMGQLNENFALLTEEISRQKYFLIKAFNIIESKEQRDCFEYWKAELRKKNPELRDRFRDLSKCRENNK